MNEQNWQQSETAQAWANIVIERWENKIVQLNVISTGDLLRSLRSSLERDGKNEINAIFFNSLYYGKFSELAVGKGVPIGTPSNRRKKPWYSKIFFGQVQQLSKIWAEKMGKKSVFSIIETLSIDLKD